MNEKKRRDEDSHGSAEERMQADLAMNEALEAMRAHKAEHHCEMTESSSPGRESAPQAS